ncbi:MAG: biotin-dependent carboxyltransferase family protein [Gemmataceae bacterium]|nr:biotin-dependent carboxyltransferase family protein [Gemmataceae bacterium]
MRRPGLYSLLVDLGRPRSRSLGVPVGGAADQAAFLLGNALVGNPPNTPALEIAFSGPTLQAEHPVAGVLFGSPMDCTLNNDPIPSGVTFSLQPGDVLHIGGSRGGARAYFCVAGGFTAPRILGSRSAFEPLPADARLDCPASRMGARRLPPAVTSCWQRFSDATSPAEPGQAAPVRRLRVLDGPQRHWFADDGLFTQLYEVATASNRMGLRLKGQPLTRPAKELVSEAVAPGAVQITNDGLPIVLGVDGQTIGGYPKIAHVIRADRDELGQLRPGDRVQFVRVSLEEAEEAALHRQRWLQPWIERLRYAEGAPEFVE